MRDSIEGKGGVQGGVSVHLADWAQTLLLLLLLFYNRYSGFCIAQEENNFQCWKFHIRALNKKATVN